MIHRAMLLSVATVGIFVGSSFCRAAEPPANSKPAAGAMDKDHENKGGDEQEVAVDQIPAAVVATVKKELPTGKIMKADKEQKHGKTVYEMEVKAGDTMYEMKVAEDGAFISKEVDDENEEDHEKK